MNKCWLASVVLAACAQRATPTFEQGRAAVVLTMSVASRDAAGGHIEVRHELTDADRARWRRLVATLAGQLGEAPKNLAIYGVLLRPDPAASADAGAFEDALRGLVTLGIESQGGVRLADLLTMVDPQGSAAVQSLGSPPDRPELGNDVLRGAFRVVLTADSARPAGEPFELALQVTLLATSRR